MRAQLKLCITVLLLKMLKKKRSIQRLKQTENFVLKMELTPELVLLSPRVLSKRKPLEHKSFNGLYTSLYDDYSKGFIYLDYIFNDIEEEKDIEGWLTCEKTYFNKRLFNINSVKHTIFTLKSEDSRELEDYKQTGNLGFGITDWYPIFQFWGDRNKEIKEVVYNTITDLDKRFE